MNKLNVVTCASHDFTPPGMIKFHTTNTRGEVHHSLQWMGLYSVQTSLIVDVDHTRVRATSKKETIRRDSQCVANNTTLINKLVNTTTSGQFPHVHFSIVYSEQHSTQHTVWSRSPHFPWTTSSGCQEWRLLPGLYRSSWGQLSIALSVLTHSTGQEVINWHIKVTLLETSGM